MLQGPAGAALPASELQKKLVGAPPLPFATPCCCGLAERCCVAGWTGGALCGVLPQAGTNRGLGATLLLLRRPAEALGHLVRAMKAYVGLYGPRAPPLMDVFEFAGLAHWAMAAACNAAAAGSAGGLSVAALVGGGSAGGGAALEEEVRRSLNEALVGEAAGALGPDAWSDGPKNVEAALVYLDNAVELRREHQNTDWPEFLVSCRAGSARHLAAARRALAPRGARVVVHRAPSRNSCPCRCASATAPSCSCRWGSPTRPSCAGACSRP